jgi:hypothetical protein
MRAKVHEIETVIAPVLVRQVQQRRRQQSAAVLAVFACGNAQHHAFDDLADGQLGQNASRIAVQLRQFGALENTQIDTALSSTARRKRSRSM